ncbi:hypothetical protein ACWDOR_15700 [Streptosporangium canum]
MTDAPFAERLSDFCVPGVSPARLRDRTALPVTPPDLLSRTLDPPPVTARRTPILDLLRPAYQALAEHDHARAVAPAARSRERPTTSLSGWCRDPV